jgi:hypothetical protein
MELAEGHEPGLRVHLCLSLSCLLLIYKFRLISRVLSYSNSTLGAIVCSVPPPPLFLSPVHEHNTQAKGACPRSGTLSSIYTTSLLKTIYLHYPIFFEVYQTFVSTAMNFRLTPSSDDPSIPAQSTTTPICLPILNRQRLRSASGQSTVLRISSQRPLSLRL